MGIGQLALRVKINGNRGQQLIRTVLGHCWTPAAAVAAIQGRNCRAIASIGIEVGLANLMLVNAFSLKNFTFITNPAYRNIFQPLPYRSTALINIIPLHTAAAQHLIFFDSSVQAIHSVKSCKFSIFSAGFLDFYFPL